MTWVASFYRFCSIDDAAALRTAVEDACIAHRLRGTVLLAPEGVNAALAGERRNLAACIADHFPSMAVNWSRAAPDNPVFQRLKVRVKEEIVGFDSPLTPATPVAKRVGAAAWNALLDAPDVLVLDARNDYESRIGTFRGAKPAGTASFREFKAFVRDSLDPRRDQRIAMFCTGGIRCEKASAYLIAQGFADTSQLDGGILGYLADTDPAANAFAGECFVFDQRVSVKADLRQGGYALCPACGEPVAVDDQSRHQQHAGGCRPPGGPAA